MGNSGNRAGINHLPFIKVGDFAPLGGRSIGAGKVGKSEKLGFGGLIFIFEKSFSNIYN